MTVSGAALSIRVSRVRRIVEWVVRARSSASAVVHNTLSQAILFVLYFVNGVVVARGLGAGGRGELTAMMVWPSLFGAVFGLGLPTAFIYYAKREPEREAPLFTAALALSVGLSAIAVGVALIVLPVYLWRYDAQTVRMAQILVLTTPQVLLGWLIASFLQVRHRFDVYNFMQYGPTIITLAALATLTLSHHLTPTLAACCYVVPIFIANVAVFAAIVKRMPLDFGSLAASARRLLGYGGRAAGGNIIGIVAQQVDQVIVVGFFTAAELGLYSVALSISRVLNVAFGATYVTMLSKAPALAPDELTAFIGRALRLTAVASLVGSVALAALLPVILPHAYGGGFVSSIPVADTLMIEVNVSGWATVLSVAFLARNRPGTVTFLQGTSTGITVALMFVLLPRFGLQGAAMALIAGAAFRCVALAALYRGVVGTPASRLLSGARADVGYVLTTLRTHARGAAP